MKKAHIPLIFSVIMIVSGFLSAFAVVGRIRLVDILTLFFTGFGAGAGMVKTVLDFRSGRKIKMQPDNMV